MAERKGKLVRLRVSTPAGVALDTDVDFVLLRTVQGDMGVLHGHEPCAVQLDYGVLQAKREKQPAALLAVMGGFAVVSSGMVAVATPMAEAPEKIEERLAAIEKERADNRRMEMQSDYEMHRAEKALRRTLVHMDVSSYAIIKGKDEGEDQA